MKTFKILLVTLFVTIISASCSRTVSDIREAIATAESAIEQAKYDEARNICEDLIKDEKATVLLSANDYCKIALILQKISDATDASDLTATAVNCYQSAEKISGDSIMSFLSSLQPADASSFLNVMLVASGQTFKLDPDEENVDTINLDTIDYNSIPVDTI